MNKMKGASVVVVLLMLMVPMVSCVGTINELCNGPLVSGYDVSGSTTISTDINETSYQYAEKTEIDRLISEDGITFTLLDDGTVRIESFPIEWNGMKSGSTEWIIPGELTCENQKYEVSEIASDAKIPTDVNGTALKGITKLVIPSSLVKICDDGNPSTNNYSLAPSSGGGVFSYLLNELVIPEDSKLEYIGNGSFLSLGNGELKTISLPSSVKYVGDCAFANLSSISIPSDSKLEYVGDGAFGSLMSDCTLVLPNTVTHIGAASPFGEASVSIPSMIVENGIVFSGSDKREVISYIGTSQNITIPEGVEIIGQEAFFGTKIVTISLPSSLKTIGKYAFASCSNLVKVSFDPSTSSLSSIGDYAFASRSSEDQNRLEQFGNVEKTFIIPDSVVEVGDYCFAVVGTNYTVLIVADKGNTKIGSMVVGSGIQYIGSYSFMNFFGLENIEFKDSKDDTYLVISDHAFSQNGYKDGVDGFNSDRTRKISFNPEKFGLTELGEGAFSVQNTGLTSSDLVQFGNVEESMIIPSTVSNIDSNVFVTWKTTVSNDDYLSIPNIEVLEFKENNNLITIKDKTFRGFTGLKSIDLTPLKALETIGANSFAISSSSGSTLDCLLFPETLTSIGQAAFNYWNYNSDSEKIVLHDSIDDIGSYAFISIYVDRFEYPGPMVSYKIDSFKKLDGNYDHSEVAYVKNTNEEIGKLKLTNPLCIYESTKYVFTSSKVNNIIGVGQNELFSIIEMGELYNSKPGYTHSNTALVYNHDGLEELVYIGGSKGTLYIPDTIDIIGSDAFKNTGTRADSIIISGEDTRWTIGFVYSTIQTVVSNSLNISGSFDGSIFFTSQDSYLESDVNVKGFIGWITDIPMGKGSDGIPNGRNYIILNNGAPKGTVISGGVTEVDGGSEIKLNATSVGGYAVYDLSMKAGESSSGMNDLEVGEDGTFSIPVSSESVAPKYLSISPSSRDGSDIKKIIIHSNGGVFSDGNATAVVTIPTGMTLLDDELVIPMKDRSEIVGWYSDSGLTMLYDMDARVVDDVNLYPKWVDVGPAIYFKGPISVLVDDVSITSGQRVNGTVALSFKASSGYDFDHWLLTTFDGSKTIITDDDITFVPTSDTTITVEMRVYSGADLESVIYTDTPTSGIIKSWTVGGYVDTSMGMWSGLSSTPISVDDRVYLRISSKLYMLESDTGYILKSVDSKTATDYYHYVGYGDGQILDFLTNKVYDLDLNYLYTMPVNMTSATYHDGYFYGPGTDGKVYRFSSAIPSEPCVKTIDPSWVSGYSWYGMYGQCSTPEFVDGFMYYISTEGSNRYIVSVSLETGAVQRVELPGISNHMLDDGWLTYHDGRLYLTSYTVGLFGDQTVNDWAKITSISIDGGSFSDVEYHVVTVGSVNMSSMLSKFVVVDGIGFINASGGNQMSSKSYLIAYDVSSMECLKSIESERSHGSIVVSDRGGEYYIYLLPYSTGKQLCIYQYVLESNSFKKITNVYDNKDWNDTYNSQAIRSDSNGQIYWYNDTGFVTSYTTVDENLYYFLIYDGSVAKWVVSNGRSVLDAAASTSLVSVSGLTVSGARLSTDVQYSSGWSVYVMRDSASVDEGYVLGDTYGWCPVVDNTFTSSRDLNSHYIALIKGTDVPSEGSIWYYSSTDQYIFQNNIGDRSIIGKEFITDSQSFHSVSKGISHDCDFEISTDLALSGTMVKLDITPKDSVTIKTVSYCSSSGKVVYITPGVDGLYSFEMPDDDVIVNVICGRDVTYVLSGDVIEENGKATITLSVSDKKGTEELDSPYVVIIAKYSLGDGLSAYTNLYMRVHAVDGSYSDKVAVSSDGLIGVTMHVVDGMPTGMIVDYSNIVIYSVSSDE